MWINPEYIGGVGGGYWNAGYFDDDETINELVYDVCYCKPFDGFADFSLWIVVDDELTAMIPP